MVARAESVPRLGVKYSWDLYQNNANENITTEILAADLKAP